MRIVQQSSRILTIEQKENWPTVLILSFGLLFVIANAKEFGSSNFTFSLLGISFFVFIVVNICIQITTVTICTIDKDAGSLLLSDKNCFRTKISTKSLNDIREIRSCVHTDSDSSDTYSVESILANGESFCLTRSPSLDEKQSQEIAALLQKFINDV
jgi:hypothetical protein